jgi:predicted secreted protein
VLTRRAFVIGAATLLSAAGARAQNAARHHAPVLDVPILTEDPTAVPVIVSVEHPMEPDHYIRSIRVSLPTDPVPAKGTYGFTPLSGRAWVSFQMRSGAGGVIRAEAEDTRHGKSSATAEVRVAEGGCGVAPDTVNKQRAGNAVIRLPRAYRVGDVVEIRARIDHGSHTGLAFKAGKYVREMPEYYLTQMRATVDGATICDFALTSAVSPNPLIRFTVKVPGPGILRVAWRNNEGKSWEAAEPLRPT